VLSHVRLSQNTDDVKTSRIVTGSADLLIAADEVMAISKETISLCDSGRTHGVVNTHLIPIADFIHNRDFDFQNRKVDSVLQGALTKDSAFMDFTKIAEGLLGDAIATNMMMMGYAYQQGRLPLSAQSLLQAIEINGVSIKMNTQAFQLGRLAAADPTRLAQMIKGKDEAAAPKSLDAMSLDEIIAHRSQLLTDYQNAGLASAYRKVVDQVKAVAKQHDFGEALPRAVAINYAKLLAYKDEYEVARLYTDGRFQKMLREQFEGDYKISFNLAPPILSSELDTQGRPLKREFSARILPLFRLLAKMKGLRGTPFDVFGYNKDRKMERELIAGYERDIETVLRLVSPANIDIAIELLSLPDRIRGYGPVKEKAVKEARARYEQLAKDLVNPPPVTRQMAAE
jgi:indolepyruvate ferredoxin oxidoreductase